MTQRQMDEVWYYGCAPSRTPELKPCLEMHEATLGVGDGSGQLFVHGSYEAIKRVQKMIFELERALREALERVEQLKSELDEESTWRGIVDAHGGLDPFDDMAEAWVAREPIKRMFNAVTSVFAKVSNDDIMGRYKKSLGDLVHDAFVEGCIAGSRARAALSHNGG